MDENVTSNQSTSNSTSYNGQTNLDDVNSHSAINEHFEARNLIFGSLGTLMNSLAFLVVLKTDRVVRGRRLLLLSLIASDITLMICVCVYGLDNSTKLSEGTGCIPVVMFIMLSYVSTDVITVQLSALNFLAIHQPFHYMRLVTLKNSVIAVALTWIVNILLCVCLIGFEFSPGKTCAPVVTIAPNRLIAFALISISSVIGIMTLNLVVIIKIKKRLEIHPMKRLRQFGRRQLTQRGGNDINKTHHSKSKTIRFLENFRKNRVQSFHASSPIECTNEVVCVSQIATIGNRALQCELVPRANPPVLSPQHRGEKSTAADTESSGEPNPAAQSSTSLMLDKIRMSLLILTTYSALISMPMGIYLWCIATRLIEDSDKVVGTPFGIFMSSLATIRACSNPVFYALRFVDWKQLIDKVKRHQ